MKKHSAILLSNATSTGASAGVDSSEVIQHTVTIVVTGGSASATVRIDGCDLGGNWVNISQNVISSTGNYLVNFSGYYHQVRANISSYSSGTFTVNWSGVSY
jgi:hypothetical protein